MSPTPGKIDKIVRKLRHSVTFVQIASDGVQYAMRKLTVTWENRHREPDKRTYIVRRDDTRTFAVFTVDIPVDDSQLRALLEDAADRLYALEEEINERCH